jgi:hypothetical protein
VDEKGNLYIADSQNAVVRKVDVSDAPSLTFASTMVGAASAAQDVTVMNLGNTPLTISQITAAANYSLAGADTSCNSSAGQSLDPATSCVLGIEFTPTTTGAINGTAVLADNATPASQTIALSGSGGSTAGSQTYTLAAKTPTVSITAGSNGTAMLTLTSTNYSGTVSFATTVTSADGTAADITASATSVTLAPGSTATSTITISANMQAANHLPPTPWTGGGTAIFFAALIGVPFGFRRRRPIALLLLVLTFSVAGSLIACGGTAPTRTGSQQSTRTYVVTATPTASTSGSVAVTNPAAATVTVTVK